jgi:hypothetical protein
MAQGRTETVLVSSHKSRAAVKPIYPGGTSFRYLADMKSGRGKWPLKIPLLIARL